MVILASTEILAPDKALAAHGKSFNWAKRFLGHRMGRNASKLYQFCRILDDMADGDIINGPHRLHCIRKNLLTRVGPRDPLLISHQAFLKEHGCPEQVIIALIDGLLSDQNVVRIKTEKQLLRYCYHVAGTVGILMCKILDCHDEKALGHAVDLGIAMQMTNIARDVLEDAEMGRRYLPESWVGEIQPTEIVALAKKPLASEALLITEGVKKLLLIAETYYKSGLEGLSYLPFRAHISIAVAAHLYRQIGVQLSNKNYAWHRGRIVTSRFTKSICSIRALGSLRLRLRPVVCHDSKLHYFLKGLPYVS